MKWFVCAKRTKNKGKTNERTVEVRIPATLNGHLPDDIHAGECQRMSNMLIDVHGWDSAEVEAY